MSETAPEELLPIVPARRSTRWLYGLVAIFLPVFCFLVGNVLLPEWQSGQLNDYASILLGTRSALFFYPLLIYSMICVARLMDKPQAASSPVIRLGIYGGTLLALQYSVLVSLALSTGSGGLGPVGLLVILAIGVLPWGVSWIYGKLADRLGIDRTRWIFGGTAVVVIALLAAASLINKWTPSTALMLIPVVTAPFWCLGIGLQLSLRLWARYDRGWPRRVIQLLGPGLWSAAWGAAWVGSIWRMLQIYASLPSTPPPDYYVATAAARGHPGLVRSRPAVANDGRPFRLNAQLQYLKAGELVLKLGRPGLHRRLRRLYDRLGPRLARSLVHPLLADVAYLLLKPFEWAAVVLLRALGPEFVSLTRRLYGATPD